MIDPNRALFESVVRLLTPVVDELVFIGGCMTGILITDPAAEGIRPTRDVDAIVDVTSYAAYTVLADRLRTLGLAEDRSEGAPTCRWRHGDVIVDVMPIDERSSDSVTAGIRRRSTRRKVFRSRVGRSGSSRRRSSSRPSWRHSTDVAVTMSS